MDSFCFNLGYLGRSGILCFSWSDFIGKGLGLGLALVDGFNWDSGNPFCGPGLEVAASNKITRPFRNLPTSLFKLSRRDAAGFGDARPIRRAIAVFIFTANFTA